MIPASWRRRFSGDGVMFWPPEGAAAGGVRVHLRFQAPVPVAELMRRVLPEDDGGATVDGPRGLVTREGEYGAVVHVATQRLQRTWAWVIGGGRIGEVRAWCAVRARFASYRALAEELAADLTLGFGGDRWRPFFYQPPASWHGFRRGWATRWIPPDYPHDERVLTVFDARPARAGARHELHSELFERLDRNAQAYGRPEVRGVPEGLRGSVSRFRCDDRLVTSVVLDDGRYLYPLRHETALTVSDPEPILDAVVASVRPLPVPWHPSIPAPGWTDE